MKTLHAMHKQQLISAIAQSMGRVAMPYALINQETLSIEFMNLAFQKLLPEEAIDGRDCFQAADEGVITALQQCTEQLLETYCEHPRLGLRLRFSPLRHEAQLLGVQCFALPGQRPALQGVPDQARRLPEEVMQHIAQIPAHVWLSNPSGEVFWLSDSLKRYLCGPHSADPQTDAQWLAAIHPDDLARTRSWLLKLALNPSPEGVDYRLRDHAGHLQWFHASAQVVRSEDGQVDYLMGISVNIQAFKQRELEQALEREQIRKEYQANLVDMLAVQEQLALSQKRELLESIAGGVSHDLNNLLFVINLNCNMLKKHLSNEQSRGYLEVIQKTVKRANRLATQLTSFSGRKSQSLQPADPHDLIEDVQELLVNAGGAEVDFTLELAEHLGVIAVDKSYFENALLNLAINARDAVQGRGKVWLKVYNKTLHEDGRTHAYVVFEVGDNGMGMSEEVQRRIFDPFYTTKGVGKGNGLGLPMVQNFVNQCGGWMEVQSQPGQGTQFFMHLPHCDQPVQPEPALLPQAETGLESVLIVEDDAMVRSSLAEALQELGYQVATAHNAVVALNYIRGGMQADIIVSDIRMPGELTVTEMLAILEQENYPMAVLLITGYSGDVLIEDGLVNQQYPVLFKPFSIHELGCKIRQVLADTAPDPALSA